MHLISSRKKIKFLFAATIIQNFCNNLLMRQYTYLLSEQFMMKSENKCDVQMKTIPMKWKLKQCSNKTWTKTQWVENNELQLILWLLHGVYWRINWWKENYSSAIKYSVKALSKNNVTKEKAAKCAQVAFLMALKSQNWNIFLEKCSQQSGKPSTGHTSPWRKMWINNSDGGHCLNPTI